MKNSRIVILLGSILLFTLQIFSSEKKELKNFNQQEFASLTFIHIFSVKRNQKKPKLNPKEEQEIEGIQEKLDFLDNILEEIEQELNQIEKNHDPNRDNDSKKKEENSSLNQ